MHWGVTQTIRHDPMTSIWQSYEVYGCYYTSQPVCLSSQVMEGYQDYGNQVNTDSSYVIQPIHSRRRPSKNETYRGISERIWYLMVFCGIFGHYLKRYEKTQSCCVLTLQYIVRNSPHTSDLLQKTLDKSKRIRYTVSVVS